MSFGDFYRNKRVFVTGSTGFKGSWLCIWLEMMGAQVTGFALEPPTEPSMYEVCGIKDKIEGVTGDVRDYTQLVEAMGVASPDIVFHLAAQPIVRTAYEDPVMTFDTNIMGTVNVLEAARAIGGVKGVVVITTDKCYENREWVYGYRENDPMGGYDPYSASKGCAELVVASYRNSFYDKEGIALVSARAGNVIGGGDWAKDRLIPDFIKATIKGESTVIRNPLATRPWQHVLECLSGYLLLGQRSIEDPDKFKGGWNFGPRDTDIKRVEEILTMAIDHWKKGTLVHDDKYKYNPHEANLLKLDISKALTYLHWQPVFDATRAVKETVDWYEAYYSKNAASMYTYTKASIEAYEEAAKEADIEWSD